MSKIKDTYDYMTFDNEFTLIIIQLIDLNNMIIKIDIVIISGYLVLTHCFKDITK